MIDQDEIIVDEIVEFDAPEQRRPSWLAALKKAPIFPLVVILGFVALALFPEAIANGSPYEQHLVNRLQPPFWMPDGSWATPLGTDKLGRDFLVRMIFGARITLAVAVTALSMGGVVGLLVGLLAGYFGGWTDRILMRLTDGAMAIPTLFLALLFASTMGPSFMTVIIAISLVLWSRFARVLRAEVLRIKEAEFIAQARIAGLSHPAILIRHVVPNLFNTWIVLLSLELGAVVIMEAMLGFLGAGIPPPEPTWGSLVSEGRELISTNWWYSFFPGLAIMSVVLAFNMFGDWLRDLLDPRLRNL